MHLTIKHIDTYPNKHKTKPRPTQPTSSKKNITLHTILQAAIHEALTHPNTKHPSPSKAKTGPTIPNHSAATTANLVLHTTKAPNPKPHRHILFLVFL